MQIVPLRRAYTVEAVTPWPPFHVVELRNGFAWAVDSLGLPTVYRSLEALLAAHPVVLRPSAFVEALWSHPDRVFRLVLPVDSSQGRLPAGAHVRCVRGYPFDEESAVTFAVRDLRRWHEATTHDPLRLAYLRHRKP